MEYVKSPLNYTGGKQTPPTAFRVISKTGKYRCRPVCRGGGMCP